MRHTIFYFLTSLLFCTLPSCDKEEKENDRDITDLPISCSARDCEYVFLSNDYLPNMESAPKIMDKTEEIMANKYCIFANVTSYTPQMYEETHTTYTTTKDKAMEEQIKEYVRLKYVSEFQRALQLGGLFSFATEYRKETCTSIQITASSTLFGQEPGTDLSGHFEFYETRESIGALGSFLFDSNKKLLGELERHTSISEYLAYKPIMFAKADLHLKDIPPEAPLQTTFTMSVTLKSGKKIEGQTVVTLLPE